ncbi:MAG: leucyl/phenylalanyl-tRNA--protein transferase [bacterium]
MSAIPLLPASPVGFPDPRYALTEPDGLVAAGGGLSVQWLLCAYSQGIFPWFDSDDDHVLWWSPSQRAVLTPGHMRVTRSLSKRIRNGGFEVTFDEDFAAVVAGCSGARGAQHGTWITPKMTSAYIDLHHAGYAHSVEAWRQGKLVGGLYGVSLGKLFFGESMFAREKDASKVAFHMLQETLCRWAFELIDCQIMNPHLQSLGVHTMPRDEFLRYLADNAHASTRQGSWQRDI